MNSMKVFLSSTDREMGTFRQVVADFLKATRFWQPIHMSDFGARSAQAVDFCRKTVRECDIYVGLIGFTFGTEIKDLGHSYTEDEYKTAQDTGLPTLVFLRQPATATEIPSIDDKQRDFREKLQNSHIVEYFTNANECASKVLSSLKQFLPSNGKQQKQQVFISYSKRDSLPIAHRLVQFIESTGIKCWYDGRDTRAIGVWETQIKDAAQHSTFGILLASHDSVRSQQVDKELGFLLAQHTPIIIIKLDNNLPMPHHWSRIYYMDFTHRDFQKLSLELITALGDAGIY